MGRRTAAMLDFIRLLRTTEPKHSFEVFIFNVTLGFAAGVFAILGENKLWALMFAVLGVSLGIQWWRIRRVVERHVRAEQAFLENAIPRLEAAIEFCEQEMRAHERHPPTPAELALLRKDVERARQREAAGEA